ncbi:hypothetical protein AB1Y20_000708 [Prymnesium parvum]|uniref:RNA helicase n=1 Tax=Prymnesium parvum TaxID=97485 RepID=A0AB34K5J8_PRYPA
MRLLSLLLFASVSHAIFLPAPRVCLTAARGAPPLACDCPSESDPNLLQTRLHQAVTQQDYDAAAFYRDRIAAVMGYGANQRRDWSSFGVPEWLCDRLARIGFQLPTSVQVHALQAMELEGRDAAICAATGSGKTLAYLVPALARLSAELVQDDMSSFLASFSDRNRRVRFNSLKVADDGRMPTDIPTPALLIVVPTRELGVQVSLLAFRLLGGGPNNPTLQPFSNPWKHKPGDKANMFSYKGPRNVRVAGLWDEQTLYAAAEQDLLKRVHVLVGTPEFLARGAVSGNLRLENVLEVIIDEADACESQASSSMAGLLRSFAEARGDLPPPQTVIAGASISVDLVRNAEDEGWLKRPLLVSEQSCLPVERDEQLPPPSEESPENSWIAQRVPAGHSHAYVLANANESLSVLCRLLRERFNQTVDEATTAPPRVVIFTKSADSAIEVANRLQGAMWSEISADSDAGLWGLSVLLPSAEEPLVSRVDDSDKLTVLESSLRVMEMFRSNQTSVLVTTAAATRGLDFPQVTTVLNLGIVGSDADYLHRAGRVGRIGQTKPGEVVSILQEAELAQLLALGRRLGFSPSERSVSPVQQLNLNTSKEEAIDALEDIFSLYDGTDEFEI